MTKQERNKIYRTALIDIESSNQQLMCTAIINVIIKSKIEITAKNFKREFKELYKYKPFFRFSGTIWFPLDEKGKKTRIEILKKCIELTND